MSTTNRFCLGGRYVLVNTKNMLYAVSKLKTKVSLLKELQKLVTKSLEHSDDRHSSRYLKTMRKEIDKWIEELKEDKEDKKESDVDTNS